MCIEMSHVRNDTKALAVKLLTNIPSPTMLIFHPVSYRFSMHSRKTNNDWICNFPPNYAISNLIGSNTIVTRTFGLPKSSQGNFIAFWFDTNSWTEIHWKNAKRTSEKRNRFDCLQSDDKSQTCQRIQCIRKCINNLSEQTLAAYLPNDKTSCIRQHHHHDIWFTPFLSWSCNLSFLRLVLSLKHRNRIWASDSFRLSSMNGCQMASPIECIFWYQRETRARRRIWMK